MKKRIKYFRERNLAVNKTRSGKTVTGMNANWSVSIIYLVAFFGLMYLMVIRPQQRQQKKRQEMLSKLKVNDPIVTTGGIHGRITRIKENTLIARIADKVEIEVDKSAVAYVRSRKE